MVICSHRLAAETQLNSLDSFIQECLQVVTAMNANTAQHLLNHLQENVMEDNQTQQPVKSPPPQSYSPKAHDDSVSLHGS